MARLGGRVLALLPTTTELPGAVLGHTGHETHGIDPAIPAAVFVAGLAFLGAGVYLDRREDVAPVYADVGVGLGILAVIASVALLAV
jgi:uncharacterized membrane protein YhiD involved in acid resistance